MKQIKQNIVLVILLLLTSFTTLANPLLLKGTIGKSVIYLEIEEEGPAYFGRYFYQKQLIDIPLKGSFANNRFMLKTNYEAFYDEQPPIEQLIFSKKGTKYTGKWIKGSKELPISLSPIPLAEMSPKKLTSNKELGDLRLSGINLPKLNLFKLKGNDSTYMNNGIRIKTFKEATTGIEFIRIDSGLTKSKMDYVNAHLERLHIEFFFAMLDCSSNNGALADYGISYTLGLMNEHIFSVGIFNYYFCVGMPHPDEFETSLNLDLDQSKLLKHTDYLTENALSPDGDYTVFQSQVIQFFKQLQPSLFDETIEEDECDYTMPEIWNPGVTVLFTSEGLQLFPYFGHIMAPCLGPEWAIIPYSKLKGIINEPYLAHLLKIKP